MDVFRTKLKLNLKVDLRNQEAEFLNAAVTHEMCPETTQATFRLELYRSKSEQQTILPTSCLRKKLWKTSLCLVITPPLSPQAFQHLSLSFLRAVAQRWDLLSSAAHSHLEFSGFAIETTAASSTVSHMGLFFWGALWLSSVLFTMFLVKPS